MREEKLSVGQLSRAAFAGALAPAVAGAGCGWRGVLLALPVVLLAGWGLLRLAPRWKGLERGGLGTAARVLYGLWAAALLARGLWRCAARLVHTGGLPSGYLPWLIGLLTLFLAWVARGKPAAFFRGAQLCCAAAVATGTALLLWAASRVQWSWAVSGGEEELWGGFACALESGGTFLFLLPYAGRTEPGRGTGRAPLLWLLASAAAAGALALVTVGILSPAMAREVQDAFFLMTAALGRTARVEGLVSALWLLPDLVYLGLLARSWQWRGMGSSWQPVWAVLAGAALALLGVVHLTPDWIWAAGTAALAGASALLLWLAGKNSGPLTGGNTASCGSGKG